MKKMTCMCLFVCAAMISFASTDTPEARKAAAEAYFKAVPATKQFIDTTIMAGMTAVGDEEEMPKEAREMANKMVAALDWKVIEDGLREAMIKTYTVDEITAKTKFDTSPEGRSIIKKTGAFTAAYMPIVSKEMERVAMQAMEDMMKNFNPATLDSKSIPMPAPATKPAQK